MEAKKAIVTGGSRGIGSGIALKLAEEGYDIALNYSTAADSAEAIAKRIREEFGRKCFIYQASLEKPDVGQPFIRQAAHDLGGLDLLVNNAGVTRTGNIIDMSLENLDLLLNLDFRTYLLNMQTAARYMVKRGIRGNIINVTSSRGERAYPGDAVYGGVKAGLNRAIQSIALDLAPYGIRVNNVAPGATDVRSPAEMFDRLKKAGIEIDPKAPNPREKLAKKIPLERTGKPADIGDAVVFLASDKASYITGITIRVDGGLILAGMPEWTPPGSSSIDVGWGAMRRDIEFTDED